MLMLPRVLFDFNFKSDLQNWKIVNDSIMGGVSKSKFYLNSNGEGTFEGAISLENNGGFCAVKYIFEPVTLAGTTYFSIRIKGDGNTYQFRVKSTVDDSHSYIYFFKTNTDWQTIKIPFSELYPAFRGRKLEIPNFAGTVVSEITFLIGNKKEEFFQLLIDSIEIA